MHDSLYTFKTGVVHQLSLKFFFARVSCTESKKFSFHSIKLWLKLRVSWLWGTFSSSYPEEFISDELERVLSTEVRKRWRCSWMFLEFTRRNLQKLEPCSVFKFGESHHLRFQLALSKPQSLGVVKFTKAATACVIVKAFRKHHDNLQRGVIAMSSNDIGDKSTLMHEEAFWMRIFLKKFILLNSLIIWNVHVDLFSRKILFGCFLSFAFIYKCI